MKENEIKTFSATDASVLYALIAIVDLLADNKLITKDDLAIRLTRIYEQLEKMPDFQDPVILAGVRSQVAQLIAHCTGVLPDSGPIKPSWFKGIVSPGLDSVD